MKKQMKKNGFDAFYQFKIKNPKFIFGGDDDEVDRPKAKVRGNGSPTD